jgi:hypothetical protein
MRRIPYLDRMASLHHVRHRRHGGTPAGSGRRSLCHSRPTFLSGVSVSSGDSGFTSSACQTYTAPVALHHHQDRRDRLLKIFTRSDPKTGLPNPSNYPMQMKRIPDR